LLLARFPVPANTATTHVHIYLPVAPQAMAPTQSALRPFVTEDKSTLLNCTQMYTCKCSASRYCSADHLPCDRHCLFNSMASSSYVCVAQQEQLECTCSTLLCVPAGLTCMDSASSAAWPSRLGIPYMYLRRYI
jgi:hypothetical protein